MHGRKILTDFYYVVCTRIRGYHARMNTLKETQLTEARAASKNYAELVRNLIALGVKGYVFETASQIVIYRYEDESIFVSAAPEKRNLTIAKMFNAEKVKEAIVNNQKGLSDFLTFLKQIAEAGVKCYDADFDAMVVSYYGTDDLFVEPIPQ